MNGANHGPQWVRYLPGAHVLLHYQRRWLRGDLLAGLTVAAYLVPQVMAYSEVAGLPAVTGLWACLMPLALYAVVGSSRQLSVGPESTTALMTAAAVAALAGAAGVDRQAEVAALLALAVGVVCLLGWVARLGFLANLLSRPVLTGYLTGMAVLMVVSQAGKLLGVDVADGTVVEQLRSLAGQLDEIDFPTVILATVVVVALFALRRWAPRWPGPLLVMLATAGAVALLGLDEQGIATVGEIPQGLPEVRVPQMADLTLLVLFPYALGLAVVGYSDNVVESRAFAARHGQKVDSGQELLALGLSNVGTSLLQGFPVSSSGSRTALGDLMGSRTQLFSLVSLGCVVATLLFLGPVLAAFPTAALGGVVVYAAYALVDMPEWRRIARFRRSELVLGLTTALSVLFFGVLTGIGIAVVLSLLDLIRRMAHPHDSILGYVPGFAGMHDIDDYPQAMRVPGLLVYRYDSPLFFANSEDFITRALAAVDAADPPVSWFVLNAEANVEVDLTAVDTLETLRQALARQRVTFAMARVKQDLRDQLSAAGFVDGLEELIFPTLPTAVAAYAAWYADRNGHPPSGLPDNLPPPIVGGHVD